MSSTYLNLATITISTVVLSTIFALSTIGPARILKRLQKTKYNYEVTLALYMLTPTERFIFNSILFLALSLLLIAAFLYLPEHIAMIGRRAFYYCFGDDQMQMQPTGDLSRRTVDAAVAKAKATLDAAIGGGARVVEGVS
ncbi:hypothetical protein FKW77_001250 [Venturia effusa]|uniref:Uncharacterized protein n=1 Tax=Venturia effusa TaxID=50376 RepID=A0A517LM82_9PEZI|nr:hypothetical protein FKW77_001250 [Venturia effusa]